MKGERVNIKSIFLEALEKRTPEERQVYLADVCGANPELRKEFESLLEAYDHAGDFLETPPLPQDVTLDESLISEGPGSVMGRYRLLEKIGEGGMAVVYLAEQEQPIRRKVALKIIKLGMDTKQVIARFEAERQALAMMEHPNIAKVLVAGATDTGRPYFVMELVRGIPITEYCDKNNLDTRYRLELFISVCKAIQHAHQKGIIHRDIKPSNVMVTRRDGEAVPKVIDFGIAKATNQKLTEKTLFTRYAHIIGTPAYMSPEQTELSELDIDTRSDVYSLGVLLYELLIGATPFSEEELREAGYLEMQRVIREEEPTKPSTKLNTLGATLTDIAKHRGCTPDFLKKVVRGDLDWIVMKSLEKDRARRYDTASALALDVRRYLRNEPVLAGSPGALYRLAKLTRKYRMCLLAGGAVLVATTVGLILGTMYVRADRQRRHVQRQATAREHAAVLSRAGVLHARGQYDEALTQVESIVDSQTVGAQARLLYARLLWEMGRSDDAKAALESVRNGSQEIAGAAHYLLARIHLDTDPNQARQNQERAESLLPETAEAYYFRAMTASTPESTVRWLSMALNLDPSHYSSRTARAMAHYARGDYVRMRHDIEAAIALRPEDSLPYGLRAIALRHAGRIDKAIADYDRAIRYSRNNAELAELYDQRREMYVSAGSYGTALLDAQRCAALAANQIDQYIYGFHVFSSLVSLRDFEGARRQHRTFLGTDSTMQQDFEDWSRRYVFDTLAAGHSLELPADTAGDDTFHAMHESAAYYLHLAGRLVRILPKVYGTASWSPDGRQLAYGRESNTPWGRQPPRVARTAGPAVSGPSGIEILDLESGTARLLVGFGRDPVWSPDGKHIAFARDWDERIRDYREELWIIPAVGGEPRRLARGAWPSWAGDSNHLFFHSREEGMLYSLRVDDPKAMPVPIMACPHKYPAVSPDERYVAYAVGNELRVVELPSGSVAAQWTAPVPRSDMRITWSPDGQELSVGGTEGLGLWIVDPAMKTAWHVLEGPAWSANWSADRSRIAVLIGACYQEIWFASLETGRATHDVLAPARSREGYWEHEVKRCTRLVESHHIDEQAWADSLTVIGFDQCRMGAREQALTTLTRLEDLEPSVVDEGTQARVAAFRAAALFRLGRQQEAQAAFALVRAYGLRDGVQPADEGHVWSTPTCVGLPVNTVYNEWAQSTSTDGLSLYFSSDRPGGSGSQDLWVATRVSVKDDWTTVTNLGPPVNSSAYESGPNISSDGLALYFSDGLWFRDEPLRPDGLGNGDIWLTTRRTVADPWSQPMNLGPVVNTPDYDGEPDISADGLTLLFASERSGGLGGVDLWMTTRASLQDEWSEPVNLGPTVNSSFTDWSPSMSADGLMLFFMSNRPGSPYGADEYDLWATARATTGDDWSQPVNLGPRVNSPDIEGGPTISADGMTLFFHGTRPGGPGFVNIWQASLTRSTSAGLQEAVDRAAFRPIALWDLDEAEGTIARDSEGGQDAVLVGNPRWHPRGGRLAGAIELDGRDDCLVAPHLLDPAAGPFSVAVWVKGGAPGAVIISQADGASWGSDWLCTGPLEGGLMTRLADPQPALGSDLVVTDGRWHHVGLVWDGAKRHLYVDGVKAASDASDVTVLPSDGALHFGTGKRLDPRGSWSGWIDDIRLYDDALGAEDMEELIVGQDIFEIDRM